MKRAAEKQLIKDGRDDDDDDDDSGLETGFKKADESVLAGRQIKALPRRSGLGTNATGVRAPGATTTESAPPSKFSGFAGFGTQANTSAPLSFASSSSAPALSAAPKITPAIPTSSSFSFSSTSAQPPLFGGASVSSSASPATKAFASIVGSSSADPIAPTSIEDDQREIDYYKALRGINVSFLSAVSKAIESDPFVDVADLLERYKALRVSVKSDFDDKAKPAAKTPSLPSFTAAKPPEAPKPPPSFSMPTPPASYAGFKPPGASSTSATSPPTGGGFVPKLETSKSAPSLGSPFSFGTSKPAAESSATSEPPKSAFSFGSTSTSSPATSAPGSAFSFGAPSSSNTSFFGSKAPGSSTSLFPPSTSSPSLFGASSSSASIFGAGSTFGAKPLAADSSNDADDEKEKDKDEKDEKKPPAVPFTFSSSGSSTPFGAGTGATTPEKDKDKEQAGSGFSFGSASPGKPSVFSGFGTAKAGSIGNPVGFGFGSPPRTPDIDGAAGSSSDSGPVKSLPFSFGAPPAKASPFAFGSGAPLMTSSASGEDKKEGSSGEGTPAPAEEPKPLLASSSAHDLEGEGEEDEETTHEIRSKVFKMTKDKDGKAQWGDLGVGMLRLKRHKETEARRVLLRNSGTGKITINFLVHGGMNPTVSDKVVSFMGHADGASTPYRIRCKTADQAKELKAALDRELEFVKSKDS